jgi:hypothetical protein
MKQLTFKLIEDRTWDESDPKIVHHFTGTEDEIMVWIHDHTPFSAFEALTNQGYKLEINQ